MGHILLSVPDIKDEDAVLTEEDAKTVLIYFWPQYSVVISAKTMTIEFRGFAQTVLVAAIDGSHQLQYIDSIKNLIFKNPRRFQLTGIIKKLTKGIVKGWWKNIRSLRDLEKVEIYDSVRTTIAYNLNEKLNMMLNDIASNSLKRRFFAYIEAGMEKIT